MSQETSEPDYKTLYEEQVRKYQRLRNGVQYGLRKVDKEATEVENRLKKSADLENFGKRDGFSRAHTIMVETILEHIKDYKHDK